MSSFSCGVLIFGMIGLSSLASVVVLGVVYGYVSGVCKYFFPYNAQVSNKFIISRRQCDGASTCGSFDA